MGKGRKSKEGKKFMIRLVMIIIILALVIIVHEWGHFIAARAMGVKVNEFAIGMGPKIWSNKKGETLYSLRMLPIGGVCSMEGESAEPGEKIDERSLLTKKPWQRFIIFVAGAVMNFILALVFFTIVITYIGQGSTIIASLEKNMPAYIILKEGDKILAIDNQRVNSLEEISASLKSNKEDYLFKIERGNEGIKTFSIKAKWIEDEGRMRFGFTTTRQHFRMFTNLKKSIYMTGVIIKETFEGFIQLITGKVAAEQLAGIVGVAQISSKAWDEGMEKSIWAAVINLISIGGIISANLGVLNLLPFPALDGGRIFFTLIEILRGKAIDPEKEGMVHFVGFVLLMGLMAFVLYNDVMRIIK